MATMMTGDELKEGESPTQAREVTLTLPVSAGALRAVRVGFNPDQITDVGRAHLLAACFFTLLESHFKKMPQHPPEGSHPHIYQQHQREVQMIQEQNRHIALALTNIELASMYGVKGITTDVYWSKNVKP